MHGAVVRFFLRTFFFRAANHPVLPLAIALILFFTAMHSFDRTHVGLVVYCTVLAHGMVGGIFRNETNTGATEATRFFRSLPVLPRTAVGSYLAAATIYALVSLVLLGGILGYFVKLPGWQFLEISEGADEAGNPVLIVQGYDRDARGFRHFESMVLPRSYLVETLRLAPPTRPLFALYFVTLLVYLAGWHVYRERPGVRAARRTVAILPFALYALAGTAVAAQYFVAPATLHRWYREIPAREGDIIMVLAVLIAITVITGVAMVRAVMRHA